MGSQQGQQGFGADADAVLSQIRDIALTLIWDEDDEGSESITLPNHSQKQHPGAKPSLRNGFHGGHGSLEGSSEASKKLVEGAVKALKANGILTSMARQITATIATLMTTPPHPSRGHTVGSSGSGLSRTDSNASGHGSSLHASHANLRSSTGSLHSTEASSSISSASTIPRLSTVSSFVKVLSALWQAKSETGTVESDLQSYFFWPAARDLISLLADVSHVRHTAGAHAGTTSHAGGGHEAFNPQGAVVALELLPVLLLGCSYRKRHKLLEHWCPPSDDDDDDEDDDGIREDEPSRASGADLLVVSHPPDAQQVDEHMPQHGQGQGHGQSQGQAQGRMGGQPALHHPKHLPNLWARGGLLPYALHLLLHIEQGSWAELSQALSITLQERLQVASEAWAKAGLMGSALEMMVPLLAEQVS